MGGLAVPSFDNIKEPQTQEPKELAVLQQKTADVLGKQAAMLIKEVAPYWSVNQNNVREFLNKSSSKALEGIRFFRLISCTTEKVEDMALFLNNKMGKLFTAISALNAPVVYGVVSYAGQTNLVLGVASKEAQQIIETVIKGSLTGIELEPYTFKLPDDGNAAKSGGVVSGVPIMDIDGERQQFDISNLMRSVNGENYTVLCVAKPYSLAKIQDKYATLVQIRDECFKFSKRNFSKQNSDTVTHSKSESHSKSTSVGGMSGFILAPFMFGGSVGSSSEDSVSKDISRALGSSTATAFDVQNGFALEMMEYCDAAIKRLRQAQNVGMWGSAVVYSADKEIVGNIIQACLSGELAKPAMDSLPLNKISFMLDVGEKILIPALDEPNPLLAPVTSTELGMLCTPPFEAVPDFELKEGKLYPMVGASAAGVVVGKVSDGNRTLEAMDFSLSETDLNKHTFVCGITGSGKTTTVKNILTNCPKPFMVIESAKKEYRNLRLDKDREPLTVYTLGKPELNCLQFNPFYIQCGINLQTHIDFLKDLFNASFSFYGPMPYILERCLHNIYRKKGWNLTLGYHPYLINTANSSKVFDAAYMRGQYVLEAHKYLFPTMQDLKAEIDHYIKTEMHYEGEVSNNIKTAMLARLDSLCVGSKGFMLNTVEPIPIESLMQQNVVFELEGLADDADKAFCVGLLVIYINEFRQIFKEEHFGEELGLQHLLVIEEAHRLLKNVETERISENMGNPKGKAVEHFTNIIAEMRSYGQGVIIAEQIPSKLAPDAIKNSSNKIIQRIVSADDQEIIANTIGLNKEDAVYMGNLKTGFALCHKEGMSLPVLVKVNYTPDDLVSDEDLLASREKAMFEEINISLIKENTTSIIDLWSWQILNAILGQSKEQIIESINSCKKAFKAELIKKDVSLVFCNNLDELLGEVLTESIVKLLICGAYGLKKLITNEFLDTLRDLLVEGRYEDVKAAKACFSAGYMEDPRNRCIRTTAALISFHKDESTDIRRSIQKFFIVQDADLIADIEKSVTKAVI